jgi:DNA helicase-2/ATP-dependent DNA helicase PcrA
LEEYLKNLNGPQLEAVKHTEGPLLILAGAGSGKTRVLTCRAAYLIRHNGVRPWNIMAITFTNKAAGEMRERIDGIVGDGSESIWVMTFHSTCCRFLRRFGDRIGYDRNFHIYDTDDSRQVMKEIIRAKQLDTKVFKDRAILSAISSAKNEMIGPVEYMKQASSWYDQRVAECYEAYEARLRQNNAMDFDDLLWRTVTLLERNPDVLETYQERFRYIMVDEYQDTNSVQFRFVQLLASKYRNLCVVGDDDQSIYKFRGANIRNILDFEKYFKDATVIRLEQNYRSTKNILRAANEVIANNQGRKEKTLWTENEDGDKVRFREFDNGYGEAEFVANEIYDLTSSGKNKYSDFAVLYRANAMSRLFEEKFVALNIPYKIVGGVNFYARREIKDLLAYLKTIDSSNDDLATERIINIPKRGIGATTIRRVTVFASENEISFYEALCRAENIPGIGRATVKIRKFTEQIEKYRRMVEEGNSTVRQILEAVIEDTGYVKELEAEDTDEARARIENIDELISKTEDYEESAEAPSLTDFLQQVSLVADIDDVEDGSDYVLLMTLHGAKGLEFDNVYMVGMEEGTFPSYLSIGTGDPDELEEERRLCYVGITRARKELTLSAVHWRMIRGENSPMTVSRFIREIPREDIELERETTDTRNFMRGPERDVGELFGLGDGYGSARGGSYDSGKYGGSYGSGRYGGSGNYGGNIYGDSRGTVFSGGRRSSSVTQGTSFGSTGFNGEDSGFRRKGVYGSAAYHNPTDPAPRKKPKFNAAQFRVKKLDHLDYEVGDKVRHVKFGVGTVQAIKDGEKDFEVTVDFENYGVKRMFASFAKLKKI